MKTIKPKTNQIKNSPHQHFPTTWANKDTSVHIFFSKNTLVPGSHYGCNGCTSSNMRKLKKALPGKLRAGRGWSPRFTTSLIRWESSLSSSSAAASPSPFSLPDPAVLPWMSKPAVWPRWLQPFSRIRQVSHWNYWLHERCIYLLGQSISLSWMNEVGQSKSYQGFFWSQVSNCVCYAVSLDRKMQKCPSMFLINDRKLPK